MLQYRREAPVLQHLSSFARRSRATQGQEQVRASRIRLRVKQS